MSRARLILATLALASLAILALGAVLDLAGAAHAWLLGFVFVSLAPPGALVMIMLGRLTRAPWAEAFAAQFRGLAGAAPWLWLLGLPIAILIGRTYPWAAPGGAPPHLRIFLSPAVFLAESAVVLGGWTALALLVRRGARIGDLGAALALAFQAVVVTFLPVSWLLSEQPGWIATDIGMVYVVLEILLTVGWVVLFAPALPKKSADDMAGFLVGATLALMYLTFVAWLIDWYGDLPDKVAWWIERVGGERWIEIVVAFGLGVVVFAGLAFGRRYRLAAGASIVGVGLYLFWLFAPGLGPYAWFTAPAALVLNMAVIGFAAHDGFRRPNAPAHG